MSSLQALPADLRWDADGPNATFGVDGSGSWDTGSALWNNTPTTNVGWIQGSNAIFGDPANTVQVVGANTGFTVSLGEDIVVNNVSLNTTSTGGFYNFDSPNFNSLTINGNVYKNTAAGQIKFNLLNGPFTLGTGDHVFALRDTGGDVPEMSINANIGGVGGIIIDNTQILNGAKESWGTLSTTGINTYSGLTQIKYGRFVISKSAGLGSTAAGTVISNAGTLSIGGPGVTAANDLNIAEPITITRNLYTGGTTDDGNAYSHYNAAVVAANDGTSNTHTFSGPITIDSTDARVQANTNHLVITSPFIAGPTTGANSVFTADGDFAGFIKLTADNTSYSAAGGAIGIRGGVELEVSSEANLGGATSKLVLGGGTIHATGTLGATGSAFMTNFGTHNLGTTPIATGLDLDSGQVFNVNSISGNAIGTRGSGTINFNGTNVFTGKPFFDGGIVNINNSITFGGFALRSPTFNIVNGATITTTLGDNEAVIIAANGPDTSTVTLNSTQKLLDAGGLAVGDSTGAVGTLVNNGGTITVGNETWIGNGGGTGTYTQTAGSLSVNNWFAVGRNVNNSDSSKGTVNLSGGTITKTGGGNSYLGEHPEGVASMTISNHASFTAGPGAGEFWVANDGSTATLTIQDSGALSVDNWLAVGRNNNAHGVLNLSGGSITKTGNGNFILGGGSGNGTVTQTGGTISSNSTWLSEGGTSLMDLSAGTASLGTLDIGRAGGNTAELRISGNAAVTASAVVFGTFDSVKSTLNLNGGSFTATSIAPGASSGTKTFNFAGGTLSVGSYSLAGGLNNAGTGTLAPGGANAIGTTAITGAYTQGANAKMAIELGTAGVDKVTSTGAVTLDGPLQLGVVAAYDPAFYAPMSFITAGSVNGHFHTVEGLRLSQGKALAVTYTATSAVVTAAIPGDVTVDGHVNFDDLVPVAQNYNSGNATWSQGDFTGDSFVNFDDLVIIAQFYGSQQTFAQDWATALSLAPEPTSLMVLGFTGLLGMRSRRR